jgi:hypothetical protein
LNSQSHRATNKNEAKEAQPYKVPTVKAPIRDVSHNQTNIREMSMTMTAAMQVAPIENRLAYMSTAFGELTENQQYGCNQPLTIKLTLTAQRCARI